MNNLTERETLLTALVIVPATYMWIVVEKAWIALTVAAAMYLLSAHIIPAAVAHLKLHKEAYIAHLWRIAFTIRDKVSSQIARRA